MEDRTDVTRDALVRAVAGQYRIEREIGRGGMGIVYLATDEQLQRQVAIKTLPPHLSGDAAVRARFIREARTAGALSHPGIVPIYSAAERDGVVYFVMRYIDGPSLEECLATEGPMSPARVVGLLREITTALAQAHAHGVVHRDIKAENVIIERATGRVAITDFGIARVAEAQPMTATGTVLGSVQYMSPEQVTGETIDGRSDLYALGVLAFHLLTGRFPFERAMPSAVLVAQVNARPPRVSEYTTGVPRALDDLIARLLSKEPSQRPASATALGAELDRLDIDDRGPGMLSPMGQHPLAQVNQQREPVVSTTPEVLSSEDAQAVWARAAELQANTGLYVPPAEFPRHAPGSEAETRGYKVDLVREAAADAGIDVRYVDRALVERKEAVPVAVTTGASMQKRPNFFLGSRTRIEFEGEIDGELTTEGFEEMADEIRRALGDMVNVSGVGRTLTVTTLASGGGIGRRSNMPRQLQINITSRGGMTRVHAIENLQNLAGAVFGGIGAGGGMGGGSMIMGIIMGSTQNPAIAFPIWGAWIATALFTARKVFARSSRKREEEVRSIVERVLARARKFVR